jgi:glycosyltransferase involved in cell wall biosynthesis
MRLLLAQNMYHLPSRGGASNSNRMIFERFAERGHQCHVVAPLTGQIRTVAIDNLPDYLTPLGATILEQTDRTLTYEYRGVTVHGVVQRQDLVRQVMAVSREVGVDWSLVSNDDPGMMVLSAALRSAPRVLYLVHTLPQLPFGPRSFYPSEASTAMIRRATGLVSISKATQEYVEQWAGLQSEMIYPDPYSAVPLRDPDPAEQKCVTLINASSYKGIDMFLALADAMPDVPFLATDSWGTTDDDRAALAARPNVEVSPGVEDINDLYGRTRVLLMPSVWDETFGYCTVEAMLRGIPVLAADVCGMGEAKLGVPYVLPVKPIEQYPDAASVHLPKGFVPEQDPEPWLRVLRRLLTDPEHYREIQEQSRTAAHSFVRNLDRDGIENYMVRLQEAGR